MYKLRNKRNNGITLIALVITIIVMLILAAISITMLTGDNSLLKRAVEAKEKTEVGQEKENISLAYNSALIDKIQKDNNTVTVDELDKAIKSYDVRASVTSEREKFIVTFSNGHKYSIYNNGKVTEYTAKPYAVDELIVKVSGDSVESPYYVNYPSAKGTIKCRVLYNDDTYGLQIISVNPITKVTLGKNDSSENVEGEIGSIEKAQNSYNRAITTLNEKAEEYIETNDGIILATDARCVGSDPLNKNFPDNLAGDAKKTEMFIADSSYTYMNEYNGKYFNTSKQSKTDDDRLLKIGARGYNDATNGERYWLLHRLVNPTPSRVYFYITGIDSVGKGVNEIMWSISSKGTAKASNIILEYGLRPVLILSSNVRIIGGEGTEAVPFEIGL